MIGQVTIGKSFGGIVRYVMDKDGAKVLDEHGVRSHDPILAIQDFNIIRLQKSRLKNAVWHTSISFAYDDKVDEQFMRNIGREYLERIDLRDHQYLIVQHRDTKHSHIHIISNRVGFNGEVASDKFCKNRTASICDKLEIKYGLTIARHQKSSVTRDKVPLKKQVKNDLNKFITQALEKRIHSFKDLELELKSKGVAVLFQVQGIGRINGISFKYQDLKLKGSSISKAFSYGRLARALHRNYDQSEDQENDQRRKN